MYFSHCHCHCAHLFVTTQCIKYSSHKHLTCRWWQNLLRCDEMPIRRRTLGLVDGLHPIPFTIIPPSVCRSKAPAANECWTSEAHNREPPFATRSDCVDRDRNRPLVTKCSAALRHGTGDSSLADMFVWQTIDYIARSFTLVSGPKQHRVCYDNV